MTTSIVALINSLALAVQPAVYAIAFIVEAPIYPITPIVQPAVDAIAFTIETV